MHAAVGAGDIVIDTMSGRVEGAAAHEHLAIGLLRVSTYLLRPFNLFGASYVARLMRRLLPSRKSISYRLAEDSVMRTGWCDNYWSFLCLPRFNYEASIRTLIDGSHDVDYGFIDAGANFGYWSVLVSSRWGGSRPVVAIEAAADTFGRLEENCRLNDNRFTVLNRAIGARSGEQVRLYGVKHEQRTTVAPSADAKPILDSVTITLDEVAAMPEFARVGSFMVKLDVEGVEIPAFAGAPRLLDGNSVFVYEEHGSDRGHATTHHVLNSLGMRVFWLGEGRGEEIRDPGRLDAIKTSRRYGYDMVASRSPFWLSRLEKMTGASGIQPGALKDAA
jgi:FkbM family methyltransferase